MLVTEPRIPILFGIPKTHKEVFLPPFRLIVSSNLAKTNPMAIFIDNALKYALERPKYMIVDSWDFLTQLSDDLYQQEWFLVMVDVVDVFTSIPHDLGLQFFHEILSQYCILNNQDISMLGTFMEMVLDNNYIIFEGEMYKQMKGIAMGAPCALVYASLFMWAWERNICSRYLHLSRSSIIANTWMICFSFGLVILPV